MTARIKACEGGMWRIFCPGCERSHVVNSSWSFDGNLDRPTLSPSILVQGVADAFGDPPDPTPTRCHSFVRAGRIEFLTDSTHHLAGQTVDLPDIETPEPDRFRMTRATMDSLPVEVWRSLLVSYRALRIRVGTWPEERDGNRAEGHYYGMSRAQARAVIVPFAREVDWHAYLGSK